MDKAELRRRLAEVAVRLRDNRVTESRLKAERLSLMLEARDTGEFTLREIADALGVTAPYVHKQVSNND